MTRKANRHNIEAHETAKHDRKERLRAAACGSRSGAITTSGEPILAMVCGRLRNHAGDHERRDADTAELKGQWREELGPVRRPGCPDFDAAVLPGRPAGVGRR